MSNLVQDTTSPSTHSDDTITVIGASQQHGWIDFRELWRYRDLFFFLIWRDIRVRYAQSILGVGWAFFQPFVSMIIFTIIFGNFVQVSSQGVPYAIFNYAALVPWFYFSNSLTEATGSLIKSTQMLSKIYFPRLTIPLAPILGKLLDFSIAMMGVFVLLFFYRIPLTPKIGFVVLLLPLLVLCAAGCGTLLTALAIQYRDVNYAMSFIVQLLLYVSPVVYSVAEVPQQYRILYALNPMVGIIEGFRSALLNTGPMPWSLIALSTIVSVAIFIGGTYYFVQTEDIFADVA